MRLLLFSVLNTVSCVCSIVKDTVDYRRFLMLCALSAPPIMIKIKYNTDNAVLVIEKIFLHPLTKSDIYVIISLRYQNDINRVFERVCFYGEER